MSRTDLPHLDSLYRISIRIVHDPALAANVVEETYADACKLCNPKSDTAFTRNKLFEILFRNLERYRSGGAAVAAGPEFDDVLAALGNLPVSCREVVLLADVEGFGYDDISRILRITKDLVHSRLREGRTRLCAALEKTGGQAVVA